MADSDSAAAGGGRGRVVPASCRSRGIYRRKHTLRAIFRTSSLVLLVGGYALYHRLGLGGSGLGDGTSVLDSRYDPRGGLRGGDTYTGLSRLLGEEGGGGGAEPAATNSTQPKAKDSCPQLEVADPTWFAALYALGTLYMFIALAIVCDEFFVPALEEMSSENHLNLSMDVAGATLMAAGGSAPELFTSLVGTFKRSDIGIGTIVGSAVFNVLFVIGMCSLLAKEVLTLTWWPLFRDSAYYALGLIALTLVVGVVTKGQVSWWESLILFVMYLGYVLLMYFNRGLYKKLTGKELVLPGEEEEDDASTSKRVIGDMSWTESETDGGGPNGTPLLSDDALGPSGPSPLAREASKKSDATSVHSFRWPGTFRAGILTLLVHPSEGWKEKGGVGIVADIKGDVHRVFEQVDVNGDGAIDVEELGMLFQKLGHEISRAELKEVFRSLDLDGSGLIHKDEFSDWYAKSEEHVRSKVKPIFEKFDTDKSGTIDHKEIGKLLKTLEPEATETDVDDAIKAMYKSGSTDQITYDEFSAWYMKYIAAQQEQAKDDDEAKGYFDALSPPRGEGVLAWLMYIITLPLVAVMALTIPDVRRPGCGKWCYAAFIISIVWIGVFSYFMVDWVEILGNTIGIPSVVMGYTVLAAGTSVPDLFSSVIVARMGHGDMAVSSSIGSNIFDILVGLPLPWLIFALWTKEEVKIGAEGIGLSIGILMGMLVAIIAIVHCQGWKMTKTLGGLMFVLYFAFLAQAILTEYFKNPCFG